MQRKSKWPRNAAEDDPVLSIPKPRREERHAIKGSPQSAPRRKDEYNRTRTGVQCESSSRKSYHLGIECAKKCPGLIDGKRLLNSVASVIVTNRKWGKAADGTSTQVVTCLINRWKVRINWERLYNVRIHPQEKRRRGDEKDGHYRSSLGPWNPSVKRIIRTLSSLDEVQWPEPLRPCRGESLLEYARFTSVRSSWTP